MTFEDAVSRAANVGYGVRHVGCFKGQWSAVIGSEKVYAVTGYGASGGEAILDALAHTPELKAPAPVAASQPLSADIFG